MAGVDMGKHQSGRKRRDWLGIVALTLSLGLLGNVIFLRVPKVRTAVLYLLGRASGCDWGQAMASPALANERMAKWQKGWRSSKLLARDGELEYWETPHGPYWTQKSAVALLWTLAEQEENVYGQGESGIQPGDTVLDCGASYGVFVATALSRGAKRVIAVDPAPAALECLRRNYREQIQAGIVTVVPKGVWDKETVMPFQLDEENPGAHTFIPGEPKPKVRMISVPLTTIDQLVEELKLERVDFIKMDIEGSEPRALAGAVHTIARFRPRMAICIYHRPGDQEEVRRVVERSGVPYQRSCGPCADQGWYIRPEVMFFRPPASS